MFLLRFHWIPCSCHFPINLQILTQNFRESQIEKIDSLIKMMIFLYYVIDCCIMFNKTTQIQWQQQAVSSNSSYDSNKYYTQSK